MSSLVVAQLRSQIQALEHGTFERTQRCVSSSFSRVDAWLPHRGFALGSFIEIIQDGPGLGGFALAMKWARGAAETKAAWAVLDTDAAFNPPVAGALGWDLDRLVLVRAAPTDGGWSFAQMLASKELGACFWACGSMDNMLFRRLQLSAERGGGLGFVLRPASALLKPCWGSLRLQVTGRRPNTVNVRLLHARGQASVSHAEIEVAL